MQEFTDQRVIYH